MHGLHPDDLTTRVERGLESVRPFLAQHNGNVELLDVDASAGAVHLLLRGSADGCQSTTGTLRLAVEAAIVEAAPEIATIDVARPEPVIPAVPVTIRTRSVAEAAPSEVANA